MIAIWTDKVFSRWLCFVLFLPNKAGYTFVCLWLEWSWAACWKHFKSMLVLFNILCRHECNTYNWILKFLRGQWLPLTSPTSFFFPVPGEFVKVPCLAVPRSAGWDRVSSECSLTAYIPWYYTWPCLWQAKANLLAFCWARTPPKILITNASTIAYSININQDYHYRHLHAIIWCTNFYLMHY